MVIKKNAYTCVISKEFISRTMDEIYVCSTYCVYTVCHVYYKSSFFNHFLSVTMLKIGVK